MDESAPQGQNTDADPPEANPASPHADPPRPTRDEDLPSPARDTINPPSPARDTVNPPSPSKGVDDDVIITGTGHTVPG